jgi:uncharacterized iron-regulated protein
MEEVMDKRTNTLSFISCLLFFFLTACTMSQPSIGNPEAPYPPTANPAVGDIYHLPTGVKVTAQQMHTAVADARLVYVGEAHDNPASHRLQLEVIKSVAERYPGQLSLGMEMFNIGQQEALDQWVSGELSEKEFLKKSSWYNNWRMDYAYYRDILNYAREHRIPVIGLNATREMVKAFGRNPLDELDEETRNQLPEIDLDDPYQNALVRAIFSDHGQGGSMLDGFLRVQTLWDETMAENIVKNMVEKGPEHRMVVMAGGNHVRFGFGIPRRVYRRLPTSYALVGNRELVIPEKKQAQLEKQGQIMDVDLPHFPMPPYDYLLYTEYESLPGERVKLGVRMKEEDGKVIIQSVVPGSTAENAGMLEGDVILALDEVPIEDNFDLIYEVNQRTSGDQATLTIEREGEQLKLDATFIPLPETDEGMKMHKK